MLTEQQRKKWRAAWRAGQKEQEAEQRSVNSTMMFWKACGHKKCLRVRACAGDSEDCSRRLWPIVPEQFKIGIRALIEAQQAGLSKAETKAAIVRELARWREMQARLAALPTAAQATAEPAPHVPTIVRAAPRAPNRHAPTPRVRAL